MKENSSPIKIGFVPLVDAAPLVYASEEGLFEDAGLAVDLVREPGWGSIRDKVAYGELEGAHALVGLVFSITLGLGSLQRNCLTGFLINSNGDAISLSRGLHEQGVTDAAALRKFSLATRRRLRFAVPHLFSSHHFLLRQWLQPAGFHPGEDIEIVVIPPSLMSHSMSTGYIDGFCVGEPYNSEAQLGGTGVIVKETVDLSPLHPEKALLVTESFAESRHDLHLQLISCLMEAARRCDTEKGREIVAAHLAKREYLDIPEKSIRQSLFGGTGSVNSDEFHVFHRFDVNRPTAERANWVVSHMKSAGLIPESFGASELPFSSVFRDDIFQAAGKPAKKNEPKRKVGKRPVELAS